VNIAEISYSELTGEITSKIAVLQSKRSDLKNRVLKHYDISTGTYSSKLLPHIETLDLKQIKGMLESDTLM
jgi:hypothetical protein